MARPSKAGSLPLGPSETSFSLAAAAASGSSRSTRLRLSDAAAKWLEGPVQDLRPRTEECYRNALSGTWFLASGVAASMRSVRRTSQSSYAMSVRPDCRSRRLSIVLGVLNRIYRYAARRLDWTGVNPVSLMLSSERPKPSQGKRRRIFEGAELEQTIAAAARAISDAVHARRAHGARVSELLGLTWADVRLADLDDAEIEFAWQVDRQGERRPMKTDGSARTVPIPRELAQILAAHKLASRFSERTDYVFCDPDRRSTPAAQRLPRVARGAA